MFRGKLTVFVSFVKKTKKCLMESLFKHLIYLFAHDTQNVDFPRNNFLNTYDVEMYTSFFYSEFFNIFNCA
jgi:hypothetical protein